jgi:predicted RecA/RadA family phage recombinase
MQNFIKPGKVLTLSAPYDRTSGQGALVGSIFGIAANDVKAGVDGEFAVEGVFDITALATDVGAQGVKVYWDNAAKQVTVTAAGNTLIGALTKAKVNGDVTARVHLNGTVS